MTKITKCGNCEERILEHNNVELITCFPYLTGMAQSLLPKNFPVNVNDWLYDNE